MYWARNVLVTEHLCGDESIFSMGTSITKHNQGFPTRCLRRVRLPDRIAGRNIFHHRHCFVKKHWEAVEFNFMSDSRSNSTLCQIESEIKCCARFKVKLNERYVRFKVKLNVLSGFKVKFNVMSDYMGFAHNWQAAECL